MRYSASTSSLRSERNPLARGLTKPPVKQPGLALILITLPPTAERPLAHPQQLRRLRLAELRRFVTTKYMLENLIIRTP